MSPPPGEVSTGVAARLEDVSPRAIRYRCETGIYPGAYRVACGKRRWWRIPRDELVVEIRRRERERGKDGKERK